MFLAERCNFTFISSFPVYWAFYISCFVSLACISFAHAVTVVTENTHSILSSGELKFQCAFFGGIKFQLSKTYPTCTALWLLQHSQQWFLWRSIKNFSRYQQENLLPFYSLCFCENIQRIKREEDPLLEIQPLITASQN